MKFLVDTVRNLGNNTYNVNEVITYKANFVTSVIERDMHLPSLRPLKPWYSYGESR